MANEHLNFIHSLRRFRLQAADGGAFQNGWNVGELLQYFSSTSQPLSPLQFVAKASFDHLPPTVCPVLFSFARRLCQHVSDADRQKLLKYVPGLLSSCAPEQEYERAEFLLKSSIYLALVPRLIDEGGASFLEPLLEAIEDGPEAIGLKLKLMGQYSNIYPSLSVCNQMSAAAWKLSKASPVAASGTSHLKDKPVSSVDVENAKSTTCARSSDLVADAIATLGKFDDDIVGVGPQILGNAIILGPNGYCDVGKLIPKASVVGELSDKMAWAYPR